MATNWRFFGFGFFFCFYFFLRKLWLELMDPTVVITLKLHREKDIVTNTIVSEKLSFFFWRGCIGCVVITEVNWKII